MIFYFQIFWYLSLHFYPFYDYIICICVAETSSYFLLRNFPFSFRLPNGQNSILFIYICSQIMISCICARSENQIRMKILIEFKMQTDVDCIATNSFFFLDSCRPSHVLRFLVLIQIFYKISKNTNCKLLVREK